MENLKKTKRHSKINWPLVRKQKTKPKKTRQTTKLQKSKTQKNKKTKQNGRPRKCCLLQHFDNNYICEKKKLFMEIKEFGQNLWIFCVINTDIHTLEKEKETKKKKKLRRKTKRPSTKYYYYHVDIC